MAALLARSERPEYMPVIDEQEVNEMSKEEKQKREKAKEFLREHMTVKNMYDPTEFAVGFLTELTGKPLVPKSIEKKAMEKTEAEKPIILNNNIRAIEEKINQIVELCCDKAGKIILDTRTDT